MKEVKKIFFLSEEEVKELHKQGDNYIVHEAPHYELEDGTIIYAKVGYPDAYLWWAEMKKGNNFDKS